MQESILKYEDFHQGLRPFPRIRRGQPGLVECYNLRPFRGHTVSVQPLVSLRPGQEVIFPFPQMLANPFLFQLNHTSIQLLGSDFMPVSTFDVIPGESWHWAAFGDYVVFANGSEMYQYSSAEGFETFPSVQAVSCCSFNGQLIVGGFTDPWHDAGIGHIGWSKIGSTQFVLDRSNTSGYAPLSRQGEVLRVMRLGDHVMAYGTNNVDVFLPVAEPVAGFGKHLLDDIPGCASRSSVGGNDLTHVMVDSVGQLWRISAGPKPELLGYQEFFEQMLGTDIVVTYNARDNSFTIANEYVSFLLSDGGLVRQYQAITSQQSFGGNIVGFFDAVGDQGFELKTNVIDFSYRGLKTLKSVELAMSNAAPVYAAVEWRVDSSHPFRTSRWVRLNERGIALIGVTASEFRLKLQSASYENVELDYALLRFQLGDRRNARGMHHAG